MRKSLIALCAAVMAMPVSMAAPTIAGAAPFVRGAATVDSQVTEVQHRRGYYRSGGYYYYNGHRGYRDRRSGYRYYNGYYFPPAAFALGAIGGAIIGGALANPGVRTRYVDGHSEWCANRYRSYRAYDNTYQPNNGPRRQCVSPY